MSERREKLYVPAAYLPVPQEAIERELGVHDSVRDHFPMYVFAMDEINMSRSGIRNRNMRDFLLAEEWN